MGELVPGQLIESIKEFSETTKENLLGGNALEFLGLDPNKYL